MSRRGGMKYGIGAHAGQDNDPFCVMTIKEIAERLGVSPQRVHFLEKQALRKLRAAAIDMGIDLSPPSPLGSPVFATRRSGER